MIRLVVLLLVALAPVVARADPHTYGRKFNRPLVAEVFASAFAFMEPRTLEPEPIPTFAVWALGGLSELDGRLSVTLRDGVLRLLQDGSVIALQRAPGANDAAAWGDSVANLVRAGWDASVALRGAGTQGIISALFDEMCGHLDPYSRYVPPAAADSDRAHRDGTARIGALVVRHGGGLVLRAVAPDGPAAEQGARDGDELLAVDGQPVAGQSLDDVLAEIAGPEGTEVLLKLRRGRAAARDVVIERRLVPPRTVVVERRSDVLVVRVTGFALDTGAELGAALVDALDGPRRPRGVVIDLRGNRGGLLRQAVAAAETLLADGVVAVTAGRDPDAAHSFVAHGTDLAAGLPVVVVVDGTSASSAEILAAALADQHRAVVVGSSTYGKGLVQTIAPLPDGGELFITWSRVFAPLGWPLQGLGVLPQVCTSNGARELQHELEELARGVAPLAGALAEHRAARPPLLPNRILELRNACPAATGTPLDLAAAHRLIRDRSAYAAALIGPPRPRRADIGALR